MGITFRTSDPEPAEPVWDGKDATRPAWIAARVVWGEQHGAWSERAQKRARRPDLANTSESPDRVT